MLYVCTYISFHIRLIFLWPLPTPPRNTQILSLLYLRICNIYTMYIHTYIYIHEYTISPYRKEKNIIQPWKWNRKFNLINHKTFWQTSLNLNAEKIIYSRIPNKGHPRPNELLNVPCGIVNHRNMLNIKWKLYICLDFLYRSETIKNKI